MRLPSPHTKEETEKQTKQHGADPQMTLDHIKHPSEQYKVGWRKKYKATKASLDPITLTEGYLHEIRDTVQDFTMEALQ